LVAAVTIGRLEVGFSVHDRIRLQNAADAAAYSSAAMEARAFNLAAYTNRTQASHYVSAMVLQSFLSFAFFGEAWLTDADGMMREALEAVAGTSQAVIAANDPEARVDELGRTAANLSVCLFDRASMREVNGSPLAPRAPPFLDVTARGEDDKVARAKRVMGQV